MLQTFQEVLENALVIKEGPIFLEFSPDYLKGTTVPDVFRPELNYRYEGMYAVKNGVMCIILGQMTYVIPATTNVKKIVAAEKRVIIQDLIIVPMAHDEVPMNPEIFKVWNALKIKARKGNL